MLTTARSLAVVISFVAALVLGAAAPASAHATLLSTDPTEGAVLATAPESVRFTFGESVTAVPDGVEVYDAEGEPIDSSASVDGAELAVTIDEELGDGTVVVVWRVVSRDGHPVSGSLSFSVGAPSAEVFRPAASAAEAVGTPWWLSSLRVVEYVALLLAVGLLGFVLLLLPGGPHTDRARRVLVATARWAAGVAALAWLVAVPLVATYQVGGSLGVLTDGATWAALPTAEYAVAGTVAGGVLLTAGLAGDGRPGRRRTTGAVVAGLVAVAAPALTGHSRAATPELLAVAAQALHLLAGCVWLGGVVALAIALPRLAERGDLAAEALRRFSTVAAGVLVALVVTGGLLTWRVVGSWGALVETGYGRLLLLKVLTALVAVGVAAWNRYRLLPLVEDAHRRKQRRAGARLLVRTTAVESALLVGVLGLTGLLVDRSPDLEAAAASARSDVATGMLGPYEVSATLTPLATGPATLTVSTTDFAGVPFEGMESPRARLSSPDVDLGSLPLESLAPGVYAADVVLPSPGTWELQLSLRTTEFDNPVTTLRFEVAEG